MNINPSIFKSYDIRGIYPADINEENISIIIKAIYSFFVYSLKKNPLRIILGHDMRLSSPILFKMAKETLVKMGAQVIDIGLSTTPSVYFAVLHYKSDAGIQISASHNPKEYNGLKFLYQKNGNLIKVAKNTGMEEVKNIALKENFANNVKGGKIIKKNIIDEEINFAYSSVKAHNLKPFKVVADPANAMGIIFLEKIFQKIPGSKLIKMNFELDGTFPAHEANPIKFETLKELQKKVVDEKADFGIATDGDADRIYFIDEKGSIIPATLITSLIAREILLKKKGETILVDIRYIKNAKKIIEKFGGKMKISIVGHSLITSHLNKSRAAFAGESSGHYFFRETGGAESSIMVIYHVVNVLSHDPRPISVILKELQSAYESGEYNFKLPENIQSYTILEKITALYKDGVISRLDGLSINFPIWRFNIRSSNTEPLIRLNLEASTKDLMKKKVEEIKNKILSLGAIISD